MPYRCSRRTLLGACGACVVAPSLVCASEGGKMVNQEFALSAVQKLQIGQIKVSVIIDRKTVFDQSLFEGVEKSPEMMAYLPGGEAPGVVKTFLVQIPNRQVLIDAGYGASAGGSTVETLLKMEIKPEEITDVFLTHLDGDHIGGLVQNDKAVFSKATVHLSKAEYESWIEKGVGRAEGSIQRARSILSFYRDRVKTFDFDEEVLPGMLARDARGHTMGHTRYDLDSDGKGMSIIGDLMHAYPLQMRHTKISSRYDEDPLEAARVREAMLSELSQGGRFVSGSHVLPMGEVVKLSIGGYDFKF